MSVENADDEILVVEIIEAIDDNMFVAFVDDKLSVEESIDDDDSVISVDKIGVHEVEDSAREVIGEIVDSEVCSRLSY